MKRIAYGGMAEIFRGFTYDEDGFRLDVAIKKLLPHFVEDEHFVGMLTDEFKLVSHLRHPNIAEVYELTEVHGSLLIAMEFVDGKDLRSTLERARERGLAFDLEHVLYIMARALDGLHHAHMARDFRGEPLQLVHRDFSPSNLLISYDGRVKICDFGIAKASHNRVQTKTGVIKGKVKYMSPEQAFGQRLDCRSDLFSAGSVLYEMCTGQPPFQANNDIDIIFAVRDAVPTPPRHLNPALPETLAQVITRSMARSRSDRFQSAAEFRDALLWQLRQLSPDYARSRLSSLMKSAWGEEIEQELRQLEDIVVDASVDGDLGRNLIADALGPDAAFSRFSPHAGPTVIQDCPAVDDTQASTPVAVESDAMGAAGRHAAASTKQIDALEAESTVRTDAPGQRSRHS
ncbi:MAG: serine/threonine protein kinase [Polyangiales bacterium]